MSLRLAVPREQPMPSDAERVPTATAHEGVFTIDGMWCSSCAFAIEHFLKRQTGVEQVSVNFVSGTAFLQWDPTQTDFETLSARVAKLGYALSRESNTTASRTRLAQERRALIVRLVVSVAFGMWTVMASALLYFNYGLGAQVDWVIAMVATTLSLPVVGYAGRPFYRAAWRTLRAGRPGMDVLVSLGVFSAMLFSLWHLWRGSADVYVDTAVMLITLLLVGRLVEMFSRQDGLEALSALDSLTPQTAQVWQAEEWRQLPIAEVRVGEKVAVGEHETIPFDGMLIETQALVDRAALTGENTPITLTRGDRLEAGCRNAGPALTLIVEAALGKRYIDTLRYKMLELHARKGEFQKISDVFARWLPSLALCLALATFALTLMRGVGIEAAFAWALSVLVVACPCAVGLAIPVVTQAAGACGLRRGIVFKDLVAFETLAKARSIAFDKTGTLTAGNLGIGEIRTAPGVDARHLLQLAAQAEKGIMHPVAQTLRRHATDQGLSLADEVETIHYPGFGVEMRLSADECLRVGAPTWLAEHGVVLPDIADMTGKRVAVARNTQWLGILALDERLTENTQATVGQFRRASFTLALLSGDQHDNVHAVGHRAGFRDRELFAALTPEAKARLIDALPRPSIFVGDGINDTLALASATTGISVAGATQQARDIAAVSLLTPGIAQVWEAHDLAKRAYRLMRQNLGFSIVYNLLALSLAVWMPIPPVIAVTAMTISSLSVLANAARLYLPDASK
ncbi:heavy metal translocating P-type ATPase [Halomonas sp. WWR20]